MLNYALRTMEADIIIKMGFFISDLHHQIEQLYVKQINTYQGKPFVVYRGQGLSKTDFEKLLKTQGGLLSFNNFLSTSKDEDVSLVFAESALENTDMVGILFEISIDPGVSSAHLPVLMELVFSRQKKKSSFPCTLYFVWVQLNKWTIIVKFIKWIFN